MSTPKQQSNLIPTVHLPIHLPSLSHGEDAPPPPQTLDPAAMDLVGRPVRKTFEGFGVFSGIVDSFDPATAFFTVLYEDGDSEELEFHELAALLHAMDHPPPDPGPYLSPLPETPPAAVSDANPSKRRRLSENKPTSRRSRKQIPRAPAEAPPPPVPVGPKPALPASSAAGFDVGGLPVFDVLSVYTCLRSFSRLLFLSPFRLETFVAGLRCTYANSLIDSVHFAVLQMLKVHLEALSQEGSRMAAGCLGNLNWELLDLVTWPVYLVGYMLIRGPAMRLGFKLTKLELLSGEYYKQPAAVKLEILRCLCDDLVETEVVRAELNRRMSGTEPNADLNMTVGKRLEDSIALDLESSSLAQEVPEEAVDRNSDECCLCRMEGNLICCDGCPAAFHSRCVAVARDLLPEGDWYCPECSIQKDDGLGKFSERFRGADVLGMDPHGRVYFGSCGYLLVFDSCDKEATYHFYNKTDLYNVSKVLLSSNISYNTIVNAISVYWGIPTEASGSINHLGYDFPLVHEQMFFIPPSPSKHDVASAGFIKKTSDENSASPKNCGPESSEVLDTVKPNLSYDIPRVHEQMLHKSPSPSKNDVVFAGYNEKTSEENSMKSCGPGICEVPDTVKQNMSYDFPLLHEQMFNRSSSPSKSAAVVAGFIEKISEENSASPKNYDPEVCEVPATVKPNLSYDIPHVHEGMSHRTPSPSRNDVVFPVFIEKPSEENCISSKNGCLEGLDVPDRVKPNLISNQLSALTSPILSFGTSDEMTHAVTCGNVPLESGTDCRTILTSFHKETSSANSSGLAIEQEKHIELSGGRCMSISSKERGTGDSQPLDSGTDCRTNLTSLHKETTSANSSGLAIEQEKHIELSGGGCMSISTKERGTGDSQPLDSGTGCRTILTSLHKETTSANSSGLAIEQAKHIELSGGGCMSISTKERGTGDSQLQCDPASYANCYSFGQIASLISEELLKATSKSNNKEAMMSVEDMKSVQLKVISRKSNKSYWYTYQKFSLNVKREKCGWCLPCQTSSETDCLFKDADDKHLEGTEKQKVGIRSEKNKKSHLGCAMHQILSIESCIRSLLSGPWQDLHYSKHWRKAVMKAPDVTSLRQLLLLLESSLRRVALSSEWLKPTDSAHMVGSASQIFMSSSHDLSNRSGSKRQAKKSLSAELSSDHTTKRSETCWWRGGRLSRQVFNWKRLPRSLVYKSGRQAGCRKIPSILYSDGSESNRSKWVAWRAAVEMSTSVSQLLCQVKEFESNIRWSELSNYQLGSQISKEAKKLTGVWKKVIIRRKCIEGTHVKYLLDLGKRETIPAVISKHGVMLEDCSDGRKKYWVNETHVPLYLVNAFEEKKLTRMLKRKDPGLLPEKGSKSQISKPKRIKGLSHLLSREPKSQVCGQCSKDVLVREAVNCQHCNGYFHRKHFRVPKGAGTTTYICSGCKEKRSVEEKSKKVEEKTKKVEEDTKKLKVVFVRSVKEPKSEDISEGMQLRKVPKKEKVVFVRSAKASKNKEVCGGMQLRNKHKKKKVVSVRRKKKHNGVNKGSQSKTKRKRSDMLEDTVIWPKRRRTVIHHTYWLNGLLWSSKPVDERGKHFREKKVMLPYQHIEGSVVRPICCLCRGKYNSELIYVGCETCEDWFHGDVFSLTLQNINNAIGLKCHNCRMKARPTCPFSKKAAVTEVHLRRENDAEVETRKVENERTEEKFQDGSCRYSKTTVNSVGEEQSEDGITHPTAKKIRFFYRRRSTDGVSLKPPASAEKEVAPQENGFKY